jgi:hypothetical protein
LFQSFPVSSFILVADVLNFVIVETIHGHVVGEDRDYFLFLKSRDTAIHRRVRLNASITDLENLLRLAYAPPRRADGGADERCISIG